MEDAMTSIHSELSEFLERRSDAIRAKDIKRMMSFYAPDVVYFDIVPPLRYVGQAALRARFLDWFGRYESGIGQDISELRISASGDVAVASMLIRSGGTLNGAEVGFWVRATTCCQRAEHGWAIVHEHVSLPVDLESRRAVVDLVP
jgi:ketosteroid isomerase-like protein